MSSNPQNLSVPVSVPVDHRGPVRATGSRGKTNVAIVRPAHLISCDVPKVGLSDICLSYRTQGGERLLALDHINLQVKAGEFLCIVGPSGCGTSTLLHLIAGLHQPTAAQGLVDGNPIHGTGPDRPLVLHI